MDGIRNDDHLSAKVRTGITPSPKGRNVRIPFFVILVVVILGVVAYGYEFMTNVPGVKEAAPLLSPVEIGASQVCVTYIRNALKNPEAEFVEGAYVTDKNGIWKVQRRMRSRNAFMPTLGNIYECTMKRDARGKWVLLAIRKVL